MFLNTPAHTVVCLLTFTTTVVCTHLLATSQALFSFHICMSPLPFPWKPDCKLLKGEGNGTPLQYFCLENPMHRGAWWAGYSQWGRRESDTTEWLHFHFSLSCIGEGNGNPLQCSCLENPRDGGAWWAAAYGVAQSRTQLKRLSSSRLKEPMESYKWKP